jgi:hypothetical protein
MGILLFASRIGLLEIIVTPAGHACVTPVRYCGRIAPSLAGLIGTKKSSAPN